MNQRVVATGIVLASLSSAVLGQAGRPIGSEFQINTFEKGRQDEADVAAHDGGFVVVWHSQRRDGSGFGIIGRRFDVEGKPLGREFPINTFTKGDQAEPAVAADGEGDFVVVWESWRQDGNGFAVVGQRFTSSGRAKGREFRVNTYTRSDQKEPDVAMDADGNFVVVWESEDQDGSSRGVFGRRFSKKGKALGPEFQINSFIKNGQDHAAVASDEVGNFIVVWESRDQDGDLNGIFGQRFAASGERAGPEFQVNTTTRGAQQDPDVARNASGAFVVIWESQDQDGDGFGVFAQRFRAGGKPVGPEIRVNRTTALDQRDASVALDADGNFMVSWESVGQDGWGNGVIGRYDPSGKRRGSERQVNSHTPRNQNDPAIAVARSPTGEFVIVWESFAQEFVFSDFGIFGQRYQGASGIMKRVVVGADVDRDRDVDVAVEVDQENPVTYAFEIRYTNPGGPNVLIFDAVPSEWQVLEVAGNEIVDGSSAGSVPDGNPGLGTLTVYPANGGTNNMSATSIEWLPDAANERSAITVVVESRPQRANGSYRPRSCGPLYLNDRAMAFRLSGRGRRIFKRGPTLLVAVADIDGGGIVGDGSGDEDGDGRTDLQEVRDKPFTNPCRADTDDDGITDGAEVTQGTNPNSADTDGDGVPDSADSCPLDDGGGSVGIDGCPV